MDWKNIIIGPGVGGTTGGLIGAGAGSFFGGPQAGLIER